MNPLHFDSTAANDRFEHNYLCLMLQLQRIDQLLKLRWHQLQQEAEATASGVSLDNAYELPAWLQVRLDWQPPSPLDDEEAYDSRLALLVDRFGLSPLERDIFLLALLPYMDNTSLPRFIQAQGNRHLGHPTVQFALDVLCPPPLEQARHLACLLPNAPLIRHDLIQLVYLRDGPPTTHGNAMLKLDPSLPHYLMGHDSFPSLLQQSCRWLTPPAHVVATLDSFLIQLQTALQPSSRLTLRGLPNSGRSELVAAAMKSVTMQVMELDLALLPDDDDKATPVLSIALREVQLHAGCLVIKGLPELAQNRPGLYAQLGKLVNGCTQPIVVLQDMVSPVCWLGDTAQIVLTLPTRDLHQDRALLAMHLAGTQLAEEIDLAALTQRFPIVAPRLPAILQEADLYRQYRDPASPLSQGDLHQAFRWRSQQNFGELAQRIEPKRNFDDLIVPEALQLHLGELCAAIRQREHALALGFGDKLSYGLGISALFHGAPGTGKTMAAEVMAATLGVDLIKVDLSTVVNKYIGETEKNLARIFDLAALDSGVLFFDEADALFGKRGESKDAKDRHANIEVAYLLQRMEAHNGLIILSTNHRSHLDNAFSRRFSFIIKFDYPDHATRLCLWQTAWPTQIRLASDIDFERLAAMADLTGANIRNIVLAATWLAADTGDNCVGMSHIQHALKRELAKTGKLAR